MQTKPPNGKHPFLMSDESSWFGQRVDRRFIRSLSEPHSANIVLVPDFPSHAHSCKRPLLTKHGALSLLVLIKIMPATVLAPLGLKVLQPQTQPPVQFKEPKHAALIRWPIFKGLQKWRKWLRFQSSGPFLAPLETSSYLLNTAPLVDQPTNIWAFKRGYVNQATSCDRITTHDGLESAYNVIP